MAEDRALGALGGMLGALTVGVAGWAVLEAAICGTGPLPWAAAATVEPAACVA
jgi:hypothetical protein